LYILNLALRSLLNVDDASEKHPETVCNAVPDRLIQ
jgi:hypothetical protein